MLVALSCDLVGLPSDEKGVVALLPWGHINAAFSCYHSHAMYEFTPADPTIKRPGHDSPLTVKRKIAFIYIPILAFVSLLVDIILGTNQAVRVIDLAAGVALNLLGLMWAKSDAAERQYELSRH